VWYKHRVLASSTNEWGHKMEYTSDNVLVITYNGGQSFYYHSGIIPALKSFASGGRALLNEIADVGVTKQIRKDAEEAVKNWVTPSPTMEEQLLGAFYV